MVRLWRIIFMPSLHVSKVYIFFSPMRSCGWRKKRKKKMDHVLPRRGRHMPVFPTSFSHRLPWSCPSHFPRAQDVCVRRVSNADTGANKHLRAWLLGVLGETCQQQAACCVGVFPCCHWIILSPKTVFVVLHEQLSWRD